MNALSTAYEFTNRAGWTLFENNGFVWTWMQNGDTDKEIPYTWASIH